MPESQPVENFLANELQRQSHKYMVSRKIFCLCGTIMDVRRSVSFDIYDADNELHYAGILCGGCYDIIVGNGTMDKAISVAGAGAHVETFDGRERWK